MSDTTEPRRVSPFAVARELGRGVEQAAEMQRTMDQVRETMNRTPPAIHPPINEENLRALSEAMAGIGPFMHQRSSEFGARLGVEWTKMVAAMGERSERQR